MRIERVGEMPDKRVEIGCLSTACRVSVENASVDLLESVTRLSSYITNPLHSTYAFLSSHISLTLIYLSVPKLGIMARNRVLVGSLLALLLSVSLSLAQITHL